MRKRLTSAIAVALLLAATSAAADTQRYAIVIGTNAGDGDDPSLRYAERDARRFADVAQSLAGVPPERLVLMLDADADDIRSALNDLAQRLEPVLGGEEPSEFVLFFFYSGHADEQALRARGTRLPFAELRETLQSLPVALRVVLLDACRSGGITRRKGARAVEPFAIDADAHLTGEGTAIITSAAESEDAQESERLQGSFFTHHLVSGLMGAADRSQDGQVSLVEAYEYTYAETVRSTSRSPQVQHPTFAFDLRGQSDFVLTAPAKGRHVAWLRTRSGGDFVLFQDNERGPVAAEFSVPAGTELAVKPGRYLVRHRGRRAAHDVSLRLAEGERRELSLREMRARPYGLVVRKGLASEASMAWSIATRAGVSGGLIPGTGPLPVASAGLRLDLEPVSLRLALRYGYGSAANDTLSSHEHMLGLDLAVLKLWDVDDFALGFGLRAGGDHVWQRFDSAGNAPGRSAWLGRAGALLHASWSPLSWLALVVEGVGEAVFLGPVEGSDGTSSRTVRFAPSLSAGLLFYL